MKTMPRQCSFQTSWITHKDYKTWIVKDTVSTRAKCKICAKTFDISNMGEAAVRSHMRGKGHVDLALKLHSQQSLPSFVISNQEPHSISADESVGTEQPSTSNVDGAVGMSGASADRGLCVTRNDTLTAEILWSMKTVNSHYSYTSSESVDLLFKRMFPDSKIAAKFQCGETKCAYLAKFGIAPHFQTLLCEKLRQQDTDFVLLFDESMNKMTQKKQIDFHVRFWHSGEVHSRYYTSEFMGHATAEDMVVVFDKSTSDLNRKRMLQLSMDGPNVNWKFHDLVDSQIRKDNGTSLLNIGSCGLHIVHGAFKHGVAASSWSVDEFLTSLYWLFHDTPARREDYEKVVKNSDPPYPLKFCKTRWIENGPVVERAMTIFGDMQNYVKAVEMKTVNNPNTKSFDCVKECCSDPLMVAKMSFYLSVVKQVAPFLTLYQSDKPMLPFVASDLYDMTKALLARYMKPEALKEVTTAQKLACMDLTNTSLESHYKKVDVGFKSERLLKDLLTTKQISEKREMEFRQEGKSFLKVLVQRLMKKSPLQYTLTRNMNCLDPRKMAKGKEACIPNLKRCLQILVEAKRISEDECDVVVRQYGQYIDEVVAKSMPEYKFFKVADSRVDSLLYENMNSNQKFDRLWNVVQMLLLLSHGQASVERGFSVNRELEVVNLQKGTYVAQRIICDHIRSVGGLMNVVISKALLAAASGSRQRYQMDQDQKKSMKVADQQSMKRKADEEELTLLKAKKQRLVCDIESLKESADSFADQAEKNGDLTLIAKSNSMRRSATEKKKELNIIDNCIAAKTLVNKND